MKMYTVEVVVGKHSEHGKSYTKGQQLDSVRPLHTIFLNKFKLIEERDDAAPAAPVVKPSVPVTKPSVPVVKPVISVLPPPPAAVPEAPTRRRVEEPVEESVAPAQSFKAIHKGGGRWDVVNAVTKKKINTKPLTKAEAKAMELQ